MACRNFWTIQNGKVAKGEIEFKWEPGMSTAQKTKSCINLHNSLLNTFRLSALDISSASPVQLGKSLSAFNLMYNGATVESWYQGSKVYANGVVSHDLYGKDSLTCKMAAKERGMNTFVGFNYRGVEMPSEPRTVFYDWLYLNAVVDSYGKELDLSEYDAFTDIQATINIDACQARSVCIYKLIQSQNNWSCTADINAFKVWHMEHVEVPFDGVAVSTEDLQELGEGLYYVSPRIYEQLVDELSIRGQVLMPTERRHEYTVTYDEFIPIEGKTCIVYTDALLDDLCALEVLGQNYSNAIVVLITPEEIGKSIYSPEGFTQANMTVAIRNTFKNAKVITVPVSSTTYLNNCAEYDVFSMASATMIMTDLEALKPGMKNLVAMIGNSVGDGSSEWNASQDVVSFLKLKEFMLSFEHSHWYTAEMCDRLYSRAHYWGRGRRIIVNLYESVMEQNGESVTCYDLQAVCSFLSDNL